MSRPLRQVLLVACITVAATAGSTESQAGPLLDWLAGRTPYYHPWSAYYPAAPVYPQATYSGYSSTAACGPYTQSACQPVTVNYAPRTCYRTAWVRVPVTQYRPVVATDPATGCPVTCLQPCTTYAWQLSRVPVVQYRPIYSWLAGNCWAPSSPAYFGAYQASACTGCTPAVAAPTTAPYYAPPATAPLTPLPSGGATGPSSVPADQPPSLEPGQVQQGVQGSTSRYSLPGSDSSAAPNAAVDPSRTSVTRPPALRGAKPVPDPEAKEETGPSLDQAPQLLNPRDRTASRIRRQAWAITPIAWPTPNPAPPVQAVAPAPPQRQLWDDTGWRSVRTW